MSCFVSTLRGTAVRWVVLAVLCRLLDGIALCGADDGFISSIAVVRSLPPAEAARGLPVRITGIVTRSTRNEVYLQDGAEAVFVAPAPSRPLYRLGDRVEIVGTTGPGHFLPIVTETASRLLEHRELPTPVRATYGDLASGRLDCCWVEVVGTVRAAERNSGKWVCRLAIESDVLRVEITQPSKRAAPSLVGAIVRFRGVAGGLKNSQRQIVQPAVWVTASDETLIVETAAPTDLFALPSQVIATVMSYSGTARPSPLSKVAGQVTWAESPTRLYLRDETNSLEVRLQKPLQARVGDQLEVVGFAEHGTIKPVLVDAFARQVGAGPAPPPSPTTVRRLLRRDDDAELVQIEAVIREVASTSQSITFTVVEDDAAFDVVYSRQPDEVIGHLPPVGARAAFVGICKIDRMTSDVSQMARVAAFSLRLRSLEDIRVIAAPSWWTTRRLAFVVSGLTAILILAAAWIGSLRRLVARQTETILTKTRVEATREERDRIARELHDSLEQQLAGATILLDATATALHHRPDSARTHLDTARAMLRYSLDEAQRAVLSLRSRALEQGDFASGLERSLQSLVALRPVALRFERRGMPVELDAVAENHLLRVAQEAVTNALKHAQPKTIQVSLWADARHVVLRVKDDGCGLAATRDQTAPSIGQFGLIGMRERAERLNGVLKVESENRGGTLIELAFPHAAAQRRVVKQLAEA